MGSDKANLWEGRKLPGGKVGSCPEGREQARLPRGKG